jgi:hypothetical protein
VTAKSHPALRAKINRPPVPPSVLTPPPGVTVDDRGGGDRSGKDGSGDGSGKDRGSGGGGSGKDGGGDD